MKAGVFAVAAALAATVSAEGHAGRRHNHEAFHLARGLVTGTTPEPTCGCTTIYTTITGAATRMLNPSAESQTDDVNKEIENAPKLTRNHSDFPTQASHYRNRLNR